MFPMGPDSIIDEVLVVLSAAVAIAAAVVE
jgi:hypothetical protein